MKPQLLATARLSLPLATVLAALIAGSPSAFAASGTWTGQGADSLWTTAGNWSASPAPTTGQTATFNGAGNGKTIIDLTDLASIRTINFDTASAAAYTLGTGGAGAQTFTLGDGTVATTIELKATVIADQLINANVTLGSDYRGQTHNFTNNSGNLLTVAGAMTGSTVVNGSAGGRTLAVSGSGDITFSGVIANGGATAITITKTGSGTLTLDGSSGNTHTGNTTVSGGKLVLNKSAGYALPAGTLTINSGTVQCATGAGPGQIANGARLVLAGGSVPATLDLNGQDFTHTSANFLTFYGTGSSATSQGSITTGAGTLTLASTVQVNNNNNPLGATISGNLDLGLASGRRTFDVADSASTDVELDVSALITSSVGGITKTGVGVLRLSGTNTYAGATAIGSTTATGGILEVTNVQNGAVNSSLGSSGKAASNLQFVAANSILRYVGSVDASTDRAFQASATLTGSGTAATIESSGVGTLSFTDPVTAIAHTTTGQARTIALGGTNTGANTFGKIIANNSAAGAVSLDKTGVGTWILTQANTYTGATNINEGKLTLGVTDCLANNSNLVIGAGTLDVGNGVTDTVGTLDCTAAASTISLGSGAKLAFANSSEVDWADTDPDGTLTITGAFVPGNGVNPSEGTNPGSLRFGNDNTGLSSAQLLSISSTGWTGFGLDAYGYLTATPSGNNYTSWATANNVTGGASGDSDHDGVKNLVEYALVDGGERGVLSGNTITFTKRGAPYGNDLTYDIESSIDLDDWDVLAKPPVVENAGSISYTFTPGSPVKNFVRLKVVQTQ